MSLIKEIKSKFLLNQTQKGLKNSFFGAVFSVAFVLCAFGGFFFFGNNGNTAYANACVSLATGSWGTAGTWTSCGGVAPVAADTVTIAAGHVITMNGNAGVCSSLTINGTATWTAARTTNVGTGGITIASTGDITGTSAGILTTTGNLVINKSVTSTTVTLTMQTTAGLTITGTGGIAKLTISSTTTNNGTLTVSSTLAGASTLTNGNSATLNFGGTSITPTLTASGTNNTVNYTGGAQTVKATSYVNLGLSGSGAKTLTSVTTISGNLVTSGTCTAATAANLAITGSLTIGSGTTLTKGAFTLSVGTTTSITGIYANSSATGDATFTGKVTVNAGGSITSATSPARTFKGGLENNSTASGDVALGTGIQTFSINNQDVMGTQITTIPNMTITTITVTNKISTTNMYLDVTTALAGTGTLKQDTNAYVKIGGTSAISGLDASTNSGNVVDYDGAGQTVKAVTYYKLLLSGSGTDVLTSVTTIGGDFAVSGSVTTTTAANMTVAGNFVVGGTSVTLGAFTFAVTGNTNILAGSLVISGSGAKTFSGNVTVGASGTWNNSGNIAVAIGGDLSNSNTFTAGSGTYSFTGSTKTLTGTISIPTITVTGTLANNGTFTSATLLTVTSPGTFTNNSTVTATTALSGTGTFINANGGTLNIGGTSGISGLTASASTNLVKYNSTGGAQTVKSTTYDDLTIDKTAATATLGGDITVNDALTITSGILDAGSGLNYNINIKGNYTNNGTFTARGGTVTFSSTTAAQTLSGTMTTTSAFYGLTLSNTYGTDDPGCGTSFTPGIIFSAAATATNYTIITGSVRVQYLDSAAYTFTNIDWEGGLGSEIFFRNSNLVTGTWFLNVSGTQTVTYVDVASSDAGTGGGDAILAYDGTNTNCSNNTNWTFTAGSLGVDIVDSGGTSVTNPVMAMVSKFISFVYQTATGTFGTSSEKIRVSNTTANPQWSLAVAATNGSTAYWAGSTNYDYNDPTANAGDGGDADNLGGQMTIDFSTATITPQGGCSTTGLVPGSSTAFSEGVNGNSITLLTAGATTETSCYWDITGISVSQTIPAQQAADTYSINMTLTVTAS